MLRRSAADDQVSRFVALTEPYRERLFRIALSLCHDRDQAADFTQEALVRAFRAFDRFRPGAPVLPWLARILRNVHLDSFKTGRAQHEVAEHQIARDEQGVYAEQAAPDPDPLATLEQAELSSWLQEELEALDPAHRLVLILCDIEDMSYKEAADIAGVPIGTVRSRLSRGREQLRVRLKQRMAAHDGTSGGSRS